MGSVNFYLDWNYDIAYDSQIILSTYLPTYEDYVNDCMLIPTLSLDSKIIELVERYNEAIDNGADESFIGIDSNSLTKDNLNHNLFMEWDNDDFDINKLKEEDGIIIKSNRGFHYMQEASLTLKQLINQQKKWLCCDGFIRASLEKEYSTLRLSPKNGINLQIIKYNDGLLYNIYKNIITYLKY